MQKLSINDRKTRFDTMPSDWNIKKLSDVSEFITKGATPTTYGFEWVEKGILFLKSDCVTDNGFDLGMTRRISNEAHEYMNRSKVQSGDIIMSITGNIGRVGIVPNFIEEANINQHIARIRIISKMVENRYVYYYLSRKEVKQYYEKIKTGLAYPQISLEQVRNTEVILPPLKEQQKIAEILSTWDLAIEKQQQLIEKKKEFKKGLMQRLLSGEVRFKEFKDEWSRKTLDQWITPISREQNKPNQGYWRLGLRSHGKGTFHEFVEDPETVSMDKLYEVKTNDLIVNITFAWEHAIAVANSDDDGKLVSHRFPTYQFNENAYPMYFKYYVLQPLFKNMLVNISPGGAGRNRVMNKKDFLKLEVLIPSYEEQEKIAEVLKVADKEIELLQKELEALKLQKKGLMQRLLTGEVRVKI